MLTRFIISITLEFKCISIFQSFRSLISVAFTNIIDCPHSEFIKSVIWIVKFLKFWHIRFISNFPNLFDDLLGRSCWSSFSTAKATRPTNNTLFIKDASAGRPNATEKHWQWEATLPNGDISMMLNTDLEIFFDLELAEDGKVVCTLDTNCIKDGTCSEDNNCRKADTYEQGLEYTQVRD